MIDKKYVDLPNGERLSYIEKGEGDKVILAIHGNYSSAFSMRKYMENRPEGYKVYAPDMRGYGDSTYNTEIKTLKDLSDDLIMFCKELNIKKAVVVGVSLGGGVAMQFAIDAPEITEKLFLVVPTSAFGYPLYKVGANGEFLPFENKEELAELPLIKGALDVLKAKDREAYKNNTIVSMYQHRPPVMDEDFEIGVDESLKQKDLLGADWALAVYNITDKLSPYGMGTDQAKTIKCPIFMANGKEDTMVPEFMTLQNIEAFKECNLTQKWYDNAGHLLSHDREEEFFKDFKDFIINK